MKYSEKGKQSLEYSVEMKAEVLIRSSGRADAWEEH